MYKDIKLKCNATTNLLPMAGSFLLLLSCLRSTTFAVVRSVGNVDLSASIAAPTSFDLGCALYFKKNKAVLNFWLSKQSEIYCGGAKNIISAYLKASIFRLKKG